jgi:hypothetical protein
MEARMHGPAPRKQIDKSMERGRLNGYSGIPYGLHDVIKREPRAFVPPLGQNDGSPIMGSSRTFDHDN